MKRLYSMVVVASVSALLLVPAAFAQTATPSAPEVDVFAFTTGIIDAIRANLTALLFAAGLLAGVGWVMRRARLGSR